MACQNHPQWDDATLKRLAKEPTFLKETLSKEPLENRDLLLLTLAIRNPSEAGKFCKQVRSKAGKEKGQQVIGRPHLQLNEAQPNDAERNQRDK